jgi:hypothetical protein
MSQVPSIIGINGGMVMIRFARKTSVLSAFIALILFGSSNAWTQAKSSKPVVYMIGQTMIELMLEQKESEGASPAELEGLRQGMELQMSESKTSITLLDAGKLTITDDDGTIQEFKYRIEGRRLNVKSLSTGEYMEIGFFGADKSTLTLDSGIILDRMK